MIGRIVEITLENFKSYEGVAKIRFDQKFTCVVGPNGAGKSNIVDAVSFVLCVPGGDFRAGGLRDLIHRKQAEPFHEVTRTASVSVVYEAAGIETRFRRSINQRLEEHLWLNSDQVNSDVYMEQLKQCHILSRARNFLVYQGDIESAAHRQGRDLTSFFEEISGSVRHREVYEQLLAEKALKEETMRCRNVVKRNAINEKRRYAEQKSEAVNFRKREEQWQGMRLQFYLFRLARVKQLTDVAEKAVREEAESNRALKLQADSKQEELAAAETERLQSSLTLAAAEKAAVEAQRSAENLNPERVTIWNKLEFAEQQREELGREASKQNERKKQLENEIAKLQATLSKIQDELKVVAEKTKPGLLFTAEQQLQFDTAQQAAEQETVEKSQMARELEAQIRGIARERAHMEVDTREAQMRNDQLELRVQAQRDELAQAAARHQQDNQELATSAEGLRELSQWLQDQDRELEKLITEKKQIHKEIQDITITEHQIEREKQLQQVTDDLQRVIPGVHGRVVKLCRTSDGWNKAIHAALNGYLNAIVVDSSDVGKQCVQYLKDRRLEPMTFIPIASLEVQLDARLQDVVSAHQEDGMMMALKCIKFEPELNRVFDFLLGNVVIAQNLQDGKQFFFKDLQGHGLRCRLVTKDGETISADGNIAVSSHGMGHPFEFSKLEAKKRRVDELSTSICKLRSRSSAGHDGESTALAEKEALEKKVKESEENLEHLQADLDECEDSQRLAADVLDKRQADLNGLIQTEQELQKQQQSLETDISRVASRHFAALSNALGFDARQREREWRQQRAEAQRHEDDLVQHQGSVKTELLLMKQALQEQSQRNLTTKLRELDAQILELKSQHQSLQREGAKVAADANGCDQRIAANKQASLTCEQIVVRRRQELKVMREVCQESSRKLAQREADLQALQERRLDLLRQSVHDGVELPFTRANGVAGQASIQALAATGHSPEAAAEAAAVPINLAQLDSQRRDVLKKNIQEQKKEEDRLEAELKRLATELERQRPNLKAVQQLRLANEEVEKLDKDTVMAQLELDDVNGRFEAVRQARYDLFMDCFRSVNAEIDSIYKKLTMNTAGLSTSTEGGSAFLDLEDLEDPFCAGVNFTAMPPAKRVSELGQLSGGEKAMAALALLFAIHAYQKAPFLMLDEVDAHLDINNMHALATFMRSFECQTIVISLKEQLFTQCQGMVGVSKSRQKEASCIFTFDLESLRSGGGLPGGDGAPVAPRTPPPQLSPGAQQVLVPMLDTPLSAPPTPPAVSPSATAAASRPPSAAGYRASPAVSSGAPGSATRRQLDIRQLLRAAASTATVQTLTRGSPASASTATSPAHSTAVASPQHSEAGAAAATTPVSPPRGEVSSGAAGGAVDPAADPYLARSQADSIASTVVDIESDDGPGTSMDVDAGQESMEVEGALDENPVHPDPTSAAAAETSAATVPTASPVPSADAAPVAVAMEADVEATARDAEESPHSHAAMDVDF